MIKSRVTKKRLAAISAILAVLALIYLARSLETVFDVTLSPWNPYGHISATSEKVCNETASAIDEDVLGSSRPSDFPEAAVVYLIMPEEEQNLLTSLNLLVQNFLRLHSYPVILFYDAKYAGDSLQGLKHRIRNEIIANYQDVPLSITVREIEWNLPSHYNATSDPPMVSVPKFPGYHLMIRFWFRQVFQVPLLKQAKYYMRLDTDSFIMTEMKLDPFSVMAAKGYAYSYRSITQDMASVTTGMAPFMLQYIKTHPNMAAKNKLQIPEDSDDTFTPPAMNNNFEIVDLERFRRPDMLEFVEPVDKTNYIMTRRWGD